LDGEKLGEIDGEKLGAEGNADGDRLMIRCRENNFLENDFLLNFCQLLN